jgi:hypothetical protein
VRPRSLHLKRFAAILLSGIIAAAVLTGATVPPSTQEPLNLVNPLSYGSAFTDATLAAAVRKIGANAQTLIVPPGTWQIQDDLTIPAHIHIWPAVGAQFAVSQGRMLTIHNFTAPLVPVFSGNGTVVLGSRVPGLYPQWFGAVCDGRADDTAALQMTLKVAAASGSKRVWFTDHLHCRITGELALPTGVTLEGLGYLTSRITVDTPPGRRGFIYAAPRITEAGITIRGLRLIGANTAVGDLLTFRNASDVTIERSSIRTTGGSAIKFDFCIGCHVLYNRVESFKQYGVYMANLSNQSTVVGNTFGDNNEGGQAAIFIERSGWNDIRSNDLEGGGTGLAGIRLKGASNVTIYNNFLELYVANPIYCSEIACNNIVMEANEIHGNASERVEFSIGNLVHKHIRLIGNRFGESNSSTVMFVPGNTEDYHYEFNDRDDGLDVNGFPQQIFGVHKRRKGTLVLGGIHTRERGTDLTGAAPSVGDGNWFMTANRVATTVTELRNGFAGQEVIIICGETHTTVRDGGNLHLNGSFLCTRDATLTLLSPDGVRWVELARRTS